MTTVTIHKAQRWYAGTDASSVVGIDLEIGDGEYMVLVEPTATQVGCAVQNL